MKVMTMLREETIRVVWLSFNEGTAVVQSSLAIDIAAAVEMIESVFSLE